MVRDECVFERERRRQTLKFPKTLLSDIDAASMDDPQLEDPQEAPAIDATQQPHDEEEEAMDVDLNNPIPIPEQQQEQQLEDEAIPIPLEEPPTDVIPLLDDVLEEAAGLPIEEPLDAPHAMEIHDFPENDDAPSLEQTLSGDVDVDKSLAEEDPEKSIDVTLQNSSAIDPFDAVKSTTADTSTLQDSTLNETRETEGNDEDASLQDTIDVPESEPEAANDQSTTREGTPSKETREKSTSRPASRSDSPMQTGGSPSRDASPIPLDTPPRESAGSPAPGSPEKEVGPNEGKNLHFVCLSFPEKKIFFFLQ